MTEQLTGHSREQVLEAHSLAGQFNSNDLTLPQDTKMVTVISLVAEEHQDYVRKEYSAVAVEIDGIKFMLSPSQLVPERTKILPSRVRDSDDGNGNKKPVPAGFGIGAGGEQVQPKKEETKMKNKTQGAVVESKEVKLKNNTLHKLLKKFQDGWTSSQLELIEHKLVLAEGACDNPVNYDKVKQYVEVDLKNMMSDFKENLTKVDAERRHLMEAFPVIRKPQSN